MKFLKCLIEKIKRNKLEFLILVLILAIATFFRFYRISNTLTFYGDEGRDALIVKRMIVDHKFTLIGPVTSVGNMYLGPLYYYMMMIPMILFNLNPIGAAYMVAVIGVITVFLIYYLGKRLFGKETGLLVAFLYSISDLVVKSSRSSWNPNPMPFFILLLIFSLYKVYIQKNYKWLTLTGFSLGCAIQMHYFGLIMIPVIGLVWLITLINEIKSDQKKIKPLISYTILCLITFLLLSLPLIIFDARHNFINSKAIQIFFSERKPDFSILRTLKNMEGRTQNLIGGLFTINWTKNVSLIYLWIIILGGIIGLLNKETRKQTLIIVIWGAIGILGLASYYGDLYPHYLGFLFPAPFFLFSYLLVVFSKKIWGKICAFLVISFFLVLNIKNAPYNLPLYWNISKVEWLASVIAQDVNNPKYNVVWISSLKDYRAMNYRFFLEIMGKKPLEPEDYPKAEVLYVIVEGMKVNPINYPIWEIKSFGKAKIEKEFSGINQPTVYKLIRLK